MAPKWLQPIFWTIFLIKRKTRAFPYFIGGCELFATTLLIFFTTSTRTIFSSIYSIYYIIITIVISLFTRLITVFIYGIIGTISIIFFCDLQTNYKHCLHLLNHII